VVFDVIMIELFFYLANMRRALRKIKGMQRLISLEDEE
jgi:hypothetical protein